MQKILIMGLPGSGKTTLAAALQKYLQDHSVLFNPNAESVDASRAVVKWINADDVRKNTTIGIFHMKAVFVSRYGCVSLPILSLMIPVS